MFNIRDSWEIFTIVQEQILICHFILISDHTTHVFSLWTWCHTKNSCPSGDADSKSLSESMANICMVDHACHHLFTWA